MKKTIFMTAVAATMAVGAPAVAQDYEAPSPEVVQTNDRGQATQVRISGTVYEVCMGEATDNCINPRAAGLNWGNRPLDHWPGKPASQM